MIWPIECAPPFNHSDFIPFSPVSFSFFFIANIVYLPILSETINLIPSATVNLAIGILTGKAQIGSAGQRIRVFQHIQNNEWMVQIMLPVGTTSIQPLHLKSMESVVGFISFTPGKLLGSKIDKPVFGMKTLPFGWRSSLYFNIVNQFLVWLDL